MVIYYQGVLAISPYFSLTLTLILFEKFESKNKIYDSKFKKLLAYNVNDNIYNVILINKQNKLLFVLSTYT